MDRRLGVFPLEIYNIILDNLDEEPGNFWLERNRRIWASVCRTFRQEVRKRVSHTIEIQLYENEYDVFNLGALQCFTSGPDSLVDLNLTKKFISQDGRYSETWYVTGEEIHCWILCDVVQIFDFFDLLDEPLRTKAFEGIKVGEGPPEESFEQSWKEGIKILCEVFSKMINVEEFIWGLCIPLTDAYEGPMPHCYEFPNSKTIAAQLFKMKKLRILALNDPQVTDIRLILYLADSTQMESLTIGSRRTSGGGKIGGIAMENWTKEEKDEYKLFSECDSIMTSNTFHYFFTRSRKSLKSFYGQNVWLFDDPNCLPFWSILDVQVGSSWQSLSYVQREEEEEEQQKLFDIARAARALKPALVAAVTNDKNKLLSLELLDSTLKTKVNETVSDERVLIDVFVPFRTWIQQDPKKADKIVEYFNEWRQSLPVAE